ncbi:hypothetical protein SPRG_12866 [Saprolegnia parasitica CBS 223.65]|uniref:Uncharacterized protein n=1 Tax=Saprolegnia parasitica (strain CBS 223.65) TaxID=695850 RepID=A0A067C4B4_SAPPC|nr:hypothetical protein SPRG_12866 [Saprolegnia parasitica CBS 223.65]KDO21627.1 hypothetical protein SPRG_12866 [Saprolegnia parasitica CBS 223.65]|eukprot:XP_012207640.1 hypothetical protein SPRG_12866 [Saprolegnia parasitica CBS 223.65]
MGSASSTIVATTGTCSGIMSNPPVTATSCKGSWNPSSATCTIQQPSFTSGSCSGVWAWAPNYGPFGAACACVSGAGCPSSKLCTGCLKNGVCSGDFTTASECNTFANAKWCGA